MIYYDVIANVLNFKLADYLQDHLPVIIWKPKHEEVEYRGVLFDVNTKPDDPTLIVSFRKADIPEKKFLHLQPHSLQYAKLENVTID
jgi:hypothetical protein